MPYNSVLKVHRITEASSECVVNEQRRAEGIAAGVQAVREDHRLREAVTKANAKYVCRIKKKLAHASAEQLSSISMRFGDRLDFTDPDQLRELDSLLFQTVKEKEAKRHYIELHRDLSDLVSAALRENCVKFMSWVSESEFDRSAISFTARILFGCEPFIIGNNVEIVADPQKVYYNA